MWVMQRGGSGTGEWMGGAMSSLSAALRTRNLMRAQVSATGMCMGDSGRLQAPSNASPV